MYVYYLQLNRHRKYFFTWLDKLVLLFLFKLEYHKVPKIFNDAILNEVHTIHTTDTTRKQLNVIRRQRSRSHVTSNIMLPSLSLVQAIIARWPQPLPRTQSVRRLIAIPLDCTLPPHPRQKPVFIKQQWIIMPPWSCTAEILNPFQEMSLTNITSLISIRRKFLRHYWDTFS
jgi:hypothetical protein